MEWCCRWFLICSVQLNWFGALICKRVNCLFLLKKDEIRVDYWRHDLFVMFYRVRVRFSRFSSKLSLSSTLFSLLFCLILLQAHRLICNQDLRVLHLFWYFSPKKVLPCRINGFGGSQRDSLFLSSGISTAYSKGGIAPIWCLAQWF